MISRPIFTLRSSTAGVADQHKSHLSQVMRPKSVEIKAFDNEAIEPEDLEPRRIEIGRNLGTDPYQIQERFMRNSITQDVDEFGKVGAETSYIPVTDEFRF